MTDENENLMIIESKTRKKAIDILSYMVDLQKRCFSWPEYKPFLERNAQGWIDLYVKTIFDKDLKRLREFIFANIDEVPDELKEAYIHMIERIDRRLIQLSKISKRV